VSDTMVIPIANEAHRQAIVETVTSDPTVSAMAVSWPVFDRPAGAVAHAGDTKTGVAYRFVSPEYFDVLDIAVVRGRAFTPDERRPTLPVAIVSETTARALWPSAEAVGQVVRLDADVPSAERPIDAPRLESRLLTVVGVVRDVAGLRIAPLNKSVVYVPTSAAMTKTFLIARARGDSELARQKLVSRLTSIDPNFGQVESLQWVSRMERYLLSLGFWLTVGLGGLALALTLSGLFSVLSYLVEQRTREIGVRMALGATTRDVARWVLSQSIRPVGVGLLVGGGAASGLAALLLTTPAAAVIGEIVHVLDPVAYAVSLLVIVAACLMAASIPAGRAARLDPTRTLRQD
jgi:putative ABC transport system permease protein